MPSSFSTWELVHWGQIAQTGRFTRFDYGEDGNQAHYGSDTAPDFDLTQIPASTTIALMRAQNDYLSSVPDQESLIGKLKEARVNLIDHIVEDDQWTHLDFTIGETAGVMVYDKVIEVLDKYTE